MADLNLTADFTDLQQLQKVIDQLGPAFGKTVARLQRENKQLENTFSASAAVLTRAMNETVGAKAQAQYKAFEAVQRRRNQLAQEYEKIAQKQAAADQKVTQEMIRQRDAAEELARTKAKNFQSQIGGNLGLGAQGISASGSADAFGAEIERLRLKYDQIYASSQLYERSLNELNAAHRLGAISTQAHEKAVESLNMEYQQFQDAPERASAAVNRFAAAANNGRLGMNRMGMVVQQTGYQVGDFLVQVQGGTNWMVAFGQQATQLAGLLSTFPKFAVLGAGLGIAIPLVTALGAAWMRTREAQDGATESAKKLAEAQKALSEAVYSTQVDLDKLRFGVDEDYQVELLREQIRLSGELNQKQVELNTYQRTTTDNIDRQRITTEPLVAAIAALSEQYRTNELSLKRQVDLGITYSVVSGVIKQRENERAAALEEAERTSLSLANQAKVAAENMFRVLVGKVEAAKREVALATELDKQLGKGAASALKLAGIDIAGPLSDGAMQAGAIAANLGLAYNQAVGLMGVFNRLNAGSDERGSQRGTVAGANTRNPEQPWLETYDRGGWINTDSAGGGGGGGGGNDRLESLIAELQTEQETLAIWYEESQTALQSASDAELTILGGKHEAMLRLTEEYIKRKNEIEEMGNQWSLESALGGAAEIFGAMGAFNKKALKAQAVFAAGAALISTYQGAAKELAKGTLGFATAAAVIAKGIGFVAAIKSAGNGDTSGRGRGGSGVATSTVPPAAAAPTPQSVYIDSINPSDLYSGQTLINLFDALYDENDKRGKVFVVGR